MEDLFNVEPEGVTDDNRYKFQETYKYTTSSRTPPRQALA